MEITRLNSSANTVEENVGSFHPSSEVIAPMYLKVECT
jgi:hypothetical protein